MFGEREGPVTNRNSGRRPGYCRCLAQLVTEAERARGLCIDCAADFMDDGA
jgi:hypothetical protein